MITIIPNQFQFHFKICCMVVPTLEVQMIYAILVFLEVLHQSQIMSGQSDLFWQSKIILCMMHLLLINLLLQITCKLVLLQRTKRWLSHVHNIMKQMQIIIILIKINPIQLLPLIQLLQIPHHQIPHLQIQLLQNHFLQAQHPTKLNRGLRSIRQLYQEVDFYCLLYS